MLRHSLHRPDLRRLFGSVTALVVILTSAMSAPVLAEDPAAGRLQISDTQALAPTLPGAPFLPSAERTDLVLERLTVLTQLDALEHAEAALSIRAAIDGPDGASYAETKRILSSQMALLERQRSDIDAVSQALNIETAEYGLDVSIFPVASLRKPFFNDWGRPRSGGRTHKGTDLLAQIGVELRAIEDGSVEKISNGSLGGLSIYLLGDSGSRYYYAHLDEVEDLAIGERVYAGQRVGTNGDSGNARGAPHLHIQWDRNGGSDWENPFPLLDVLYGEGAAAQALDAVDQAPSADSTLLLLNADG